MRFVQTSMRRAHRHRVTGAAALASVVALATLTSCAEEPKNAGAKGGASITVGLTYTPNIQFSPFYVAAEKGYYKDAGLNVTLRHHGAAEDLFGALSSGKEDVIYAGGDEMLQARAKNVPVVDIATFYQKYPVGLIVPKDSDIRTPADLKGRKIGTPGPFGETYFGLLALLKEGGLSTKDAKVQNIGFTQQAALTGNKVEGVMGYLNNDAVSFKEAGKDVRSITLNSGSAGDQLVGVGLGAKKKTLDKRGDDIKKFVDASLRGLRYAIDHQDEAIKLSEKYVPGLRGEKQRNNARAVLKATAPMMRNDQGELGAIDPQTWARMADFMYDQGLLEKTVTPEDAYDTSYLPKS
ncbi:MULTISPECIES: ABC transporter substrate-binding protein [Streptomyces]|uniref:Riboflavin-binding protein RibY n=1 Tax=Streptomyces violaceusniger TaxID=68280 RepID=A0A4D4L4Q5_STRVO|nr:MULTISPECIES: ABC transporter substrate-binding protein [unclassified Streptomyces]MBD3010946.1 ABC transporter substrate-binding protein [Streptomyces sp. 5-10]GDY53970.1 riboflavin-binding protein RibY [Streptomyces violaceusniger]